MGGGVKERNLFIVIYGQLWKVNPFYFSYGQTGSGKTYTMMGTESDPGIIPQVRLFYRKKERLFAEFSKLYPSITSFHSPFSFLFFSFPSQSSLLIGCSTILVLVSIKSLSFEYPTLKYTMSQ